MMPHNGRATSERADVGEGARSRWLNVVLWCIQALLALVFLNASWAKLTGRAEMVTLFATVGVGQWLRYVTAALELTGGALILLPKASRVGAGVLMTVMVGAVTAHLFILHVSPAVPAMLLLFAAIVLWGRR